MPAEWEPHEATWIAWPHEESDWPGKISPIHWVYSEIVRVLSEVERVEILIHDDNTMAVARECLEQTNVPANNCRFHLVQNNRSWLRDSAPTAVRTAEGEVRWLHWRFNAWAKYDNYNLDEKVPEAFEKITGFRRDLALQPNTKKRFVLEGGAIECDGEGTLLVTEECLLSKDSQCRNPGMSREDYEQAFGYYLGVQKTIWLGRGCAGDDTHGHIDDIARFVSPGRVIAAVENNPDDENFAPLQDNLLRLREARDAQGRELEVISLPMPRPIFYGDERLPASYANFYIANGLVLVPTFNDENDLVALNTLSRVFPERKVVGIHAVDLVLGQGTLHCLTQQQPAKRIFS